MRRDPRLEQSENGKETAMKKVAVFATLLLALAMTASAQTMIRFNMPATATPLAIPEAYCGMSWSGLDYVTPLLWNYTNGTTETGAGFLAGPDVMVAFGGGPLCYKKHGGQTIKNICSATVSAGVGPNAISSFTPVSVDMAFGWASDVDTTVPFVTVQAYSDGNLMGSQKFELGTQAQKYTLVFPNWGPVTELKFIPSPGGSIVLYVLKIQ
jgi:hypothetical protein